MTPRFIELMPFGQGTPVPSAELVERLRAGGLSLVEEEQPQGDTAGPARYLRAPGGLVGFISPLTQNFCGGCNRVRVSTAGRLYLCLGHDDKVDLKAALRTGGRAALDALLDEGMAIKPRRHAFAIAGRGAAPAVARHMSATGG